MPAIPIIGLGVSAYSAYKQAKSQSAAAKQQEQLMQQQSGLANEISQFAREQHTMAGPALQKAMQYYMPLASGSRSAINDTLAPDRAQMADTYSGAQMGLEKSVGPGAGRDRAIADLYRQKAGQMGLMPFQARQSAVGQLAQFGENRLSDARNLYGAAGTALTGAANIGVQANNMRQGAYDQYGNLIRYGTQAAAGAWDWYRRGSQGGISNADARGGNF